MIEFMVIAAPRSGTAWASNWLTTDSTLCIHDPLFRIHYEEWDAIESPDKMLGVSCTGIMHFPDFLAMHPARKVILHRPDPEVRESLKAVGIEDTKAYGAKLRNIEGMHVVWTDLWNNPRPIYEYLLQMDFDEERHSELMLLNVQMQFDRIRVDPKTTQRLVEELRMSSVIH